MTTDFAIDVRGVTKKFGARTVVNDIAMQVRPGEIYGFLGPNGSGKTTLLSLLGALDRPDRGSVTAGSRETTGLKDRELARIRLLDIGFVFQTHHLIDDLTVEENVALPLRLAKRPEAARVGELLDVFGLTKLASRRPGEISVGESQRVAVARALGDAPRVLVHEGEPIDLLDRWEGAGEVIVVDGGFSSST